MRSSQIPLKMVATKGKLLPNDQSEPGTSFRELVIRLPALMNKRVSNLAELERVSSQGSWNRAIQCKRPEHHLEAVDAIPQTSGEISLQQFRNMVISVLLGKLLVLSQTNTQPSQSFALKSLRIILES
jgi:hypothetical protein